MGDVKYLRLGIRLGLFVLSTNGAVAVLEAQRGAPAKSSFQACPTSDESTLTMVMLGVDGTPLTSLRAAPLQVQWVGASPHAC